MGIRRYTAIADNTITNAYEANLVTKGTGSNMGAADSLAVFTIYGQESGSSTGQSREISRMLLQFPVTSTAGISADRTAGKIPASGSVNFYLKMFNAEHPFTLARDFTLRVNPVSSSWQEGYGLDMEEYKDVTYNGTGSNWIRAGGPSVAASASITITDYDSLASAVVVTLTPLQGAAITFTEGTDWDAEESNAQTATNLATAIDDNANYAASGSGASVIITAKGVSSAGTFGNSDIIALTSDANWSEVGFAGGSGLGRWTTYGGDYLDAREVTAPFREGWENLEVDVTKFVESWIIGDSAGHYDDHGVGVRLTATQESASLSYYTKKFFARSSQFFFKRPVIEARWDSRKDDKRGSFYYSSSLAPTSKNLSTLYMYNYVDGVLANIPAVGTNNILVSLYSGSSAPTGSALLLYNSGYNITGGHVSTGIYSASMGITASSTPLTKLFDVWHSSSVQYFTSSFAPKVRAAFNNAPTFEYVTAVKNLKPTYATTEESRFRFFIRDKDWNPNIYTIATTNIPNKTLVSASYQIIRLTDELAVIPYGTGSDYSTYLSLDVSGNYFDLDMSLLEKDYSYGIKLAYYNPSIQGWIEQSEMFRFRVE